MGSTLSWNSCKKRRSLLPTPLLPRRGAYAVSAFVPCLSIIHFLYSPIEMLDTDLTSLSHQSLAPHYRTQSSKMHCPAAAWLKAQITKAGIVSWRPWYSVANCHEVAALAGRRRMLKESLNIDRRKSHPMDQLQELARKPYGDTAGAWLTVYFTMPCQVQ